MNIFDFQNIFTQYFHQWMDQQVLHNNFLTAGVFTVMTSALLYVLRNLPGRIYNKIHNRVTFTVGVNSDNPYYYDLSHYISKHVINFMSRGRILNGSKLTVGYGHSVSIFYGHLVFVTRERIENQSSKFKEVINLVFPFVSKKKLGILFEKFVKEHSQGNENSISIFESKEWDGLTKIKSVHTRKRESIYIDSVIVDEIERRIDLFSQNENWYRNHGIPYKLGILLYGPPGTGKTSLAKYLAGYCDRDIIYATPARLKQISSQLEFYRREDYSNDDYSKKEVETRKFMILIEDIDAFSSTEDRETKHEESNEIVSDANNLSTILNVLDGIQSPEDVIIVATTNHIEHLDPAIIRKGRFDIVQGIDYMQDKDIKIMIQSFCGEHDFGDHTFSPISGVDLQNLILSNNEDFDKVVEELIEVQSNTKSNVHVLIRH